MKYVDHSRGPRTRILSPDIFAAAAAAAAATTTATAAAAAAARISVVISPEDGVLNIYNTYLYYKLYIIYIVYNIILYILKTPSWTKQYSNLQDTNYCF